jgi:hypothetical protein
MKGQGVTEKADSPWSPSVVLVRKKNGDLHFCVPKVPRAPSQTEPQEMPTVPEGGVVRRMYCTPEGVITDP